MKISFVCAIPIFSSTLQKLWIFPKYKRFFNEKFGLGRRKLRLPRSLNLLGAVTCGAQEVSKKKSFKIGKIRSFCKVLEKIGIAQTNVFCTALLGSFDSVMSVRLSVHPSGKMLRKRHVYIQTYVVRLAKGLVMGWPMTKPVLSEWASESLVAPIIGNVLRYLSRC